MIKSFSQITFQFLETGDKKINIIQYERIKFQIDVKRY